MWNSVTNTDRYRYCHGDSHCHSDAYGYRNRNSNSITNPHFDTLYVACGSERAKRNQCDFQQFYRELAQRVRCDRLSVGCLHKQLFHHLRNRLSGFARRKRDQLQRDRVKSEHDLLLPSTRLQWVCYKRQF